MRSQLLKCFYISTEEAHDPGELCRYGYDCQALWFTSDPNPRTNKQTNNKLRKFTSASSTYREKYKKNNLQNLQPLNTFKE